MAKKTAAKKKTTAKKKMTVKRTSSQKPSKAAFIRSQPLDMPTEDLIAKARTNGITLVKGRIYRERGEMRKRAASSAGQNGADVPAVTEGRGPTAKGKAPDKKNRVLELKAQHPGWTAAKIAEAAKCSTATVYAALGGSKKPGGSTNETATVKSPVMQHLDHVRALRGVILHVGIDQAKAMMDQIVKDLLI